jgi:hypothetical protein
MNLKTNIMNKEFKNLYLGTILGITFGSIGTAWVLYTSGVEEVRKDQVIIWNDDEESIPMDHSAIMLEFTKNDTIYIGPMADPME